MMKPDGTILTSATQVYTTGAVIDLPVLPATGTYTIVVDPLVSGSTYTGIGSMSLTLSDNSPKPDLLMTSVIPNATTVIQGNSLSTTHTVSNQGLASAGEFAIGFRFSKNTIWGDSDDVTIPTIQTITALGSNATNPSTTALTVPNTTPPGSYYICARADIAASIAEMNENNNALCSTAVISVVEPPPSVLEVRVNNSNDDAEEMTSGKMRLSDSLLEMVNKSGNQTVGIRFNGITIPKGATIVNAYIQFKAGQQNSNTTLLKIAGENNDNAKTFATSNKNISSRGKTAANVTWVPGPWPIIGQAGVAQRTPNIASVIQEIVNRPGWASGNSLAMIITGTGTRTAKSFNGDKLSAPLLHVEYKTGQ